MAKRVFFSLIMVAVVLSLVAFRPQPQESKPIAIGALPVKGTHFVAPREDKILQDLTAAGKISKDSTPEQIQSAMEGYRAQFAKDSISWVNPEVAANALAHEEALAKNDIGLNADPAVTKVDVTIFGLAVEFDETAAPFSGTDCAGNAISFAGPEAGHVLAPAAGDNNTLWYDPATTLDLSVYHDIVFGYKGAGVVRTDLKGGAGINLTGYTVQDYYDKVSGAKGNVNLMGDFYGWVSVPHNEAFYGAPVCSGTTEANHDNNAQLLVTDAIDQFISENPGFDWTAFDQDHDQIVDTFWLVHAGADQAAGGGAQGAFALWSHSSDLRSYSATPDGKQVAGMDTPADPSDDIFVGPYTMNPEIADVGVLAEEFGHNVFGLPDLYTTDAENSVGFWAIMAAGSWGGPLAGSIPVGMPLWFRMNAWCGVAYCNWQYPMVTRNYRAAQEDIEIGTLEDTPANTVKGVRVNLPPIVETIPNEAGSGKGAYSGAGRDMADVTLDRTIAVPATGANELSFDSYWEIETDYDYGYVQVKDGAAAWQFLADKGGYMTTTNPWGGNLGVGLTDFSNGTINLKFDLSPYAGKTIQLRLWYKTDPGTTELGWWVDNVELDGTLIDAFETAVAPSDFTPSGWTNSAATPWFVVPVLKSYGNYYLLEYRGNTKYDSQVKTAYVTTASGPNLWTVERVPYNIPGGLLYYRNTKYPGNYSQRQWYNDPPSFGPKNKLLVVDMNWDKMAIGDSGYSFNNRLASYDATIDLDGTKAFTLSKVNGVPGGPFNFAAKPAVSAFNDTLGYAAGYFLAFPFDGFLYYANRDGSTVIPARGDYSTRLRRMGTLAPEYGWYGMGFGSGNPGDDNVQHGVNIQILDQALDSVGTGASYGTFRFYNYSLDIETIQNAELVTNGVYQYTYDVTVTNTGSVPTTDLIQPQAAPGTQLFIDPATVKVYLDPALTVKSTSVSAVVMPNAIKPAGSLVTWSVPQLDPGESVTLTVVANGPFDSGEHFIETVVQGNDGQVARGPWFERDSYQLFNFVFPIISN